MIKLSNLVEIKNLSGSRKIPLAIVKQNMKDDINQNDDPEWEERDFVLQLLDSVHDEESLREFVGSWQGFDEDGVQFLIRTLVQF